MVRETENAVFTVGSVKRTDKQRSPSPPFTTSTMQQEASRKLSMTPRRTMAIAQQLYEGVTSRARGTVGLITYMRTDSLRISEEAPGGGQDLHHRPVRGRVRQDPPLQGQGGRPGRPRGHPAQQRELDAGGPEKGPDRRAVPALPPGVEPLRGQPDGQRRVRQRLRGGGGRGPQLRASSSSLKFSGYTAVYEEGKDDEKEEKESPLPALREGGGAHAEGLWPGAALHPAPGPLHRRHADPGHGGAGIGRPSTYAPTVSTILDRGVRGEGGQVPPHHQPGPGGDGADEGAVLRHRGT